MTLYETLYEMKKLCDTYNMDFTIMSHGINIKKYFDYNELPRCFYQVFPFDFLRKYNLEDMVLEFEKRLEANLNKLENEESEE